MTALTRSKRLSSQLKGENLCKKDIAQSSSVPEARGRFLAVAESALSDLINTGYSRKNAVIVLTEMISVGGLPSDNEVSDFFPMGFGIKPQDMNKKPGAEVVVVRGLFHHVQRYSFGFLLKNLDKFYAMCDYFHQASVMMARVLFGT